MSPQQDNGPQGQRRLEELRRRILENRPGSAREQNSPWLWPVVILLALLLWLGFWAWTSYGGWWGRHSHREGVPTTEQGQSPSISEHALDR